MGSMLTPLRAGSLGSVHRPLIVSYPNKLSRDASDNGLLLPHAIQYIMGARYWHWHGQHHGHSDFP